MVSRRVIQTTEMRFQGILCNARKLALYAMIRLQASKQAGLRANTF